MKLSSVISMCNIKFKILFKSDFSIKGITNNSKKMKENFIFAAIQGKKFDGHQFIKDFNHLQNFAIISNSKRRVLRYLKKNPKNFSLIETHNPIKLSNEIEYEWHIDEKLLYSIFNQSKQLDNYLVINSSVSIKELNFKLNDLKSRVNSFIFIVRQLLIAIFF